MTLSTEGIAAATLAMLLGLLLVLAGGFLRRRQGLGGGRTIALDNVTLVSHRLGLTGRVDRLIRDGGVLIPEEWKSARLLRPHHLAQMGVYFLLIEDQLHQRPDYGIIVCGDGTRHRIDNDEALRVWVLGLVDRIRSAKNNVAQQSWSIPGQDSAAPAG